MIYTPKRRSNVSRRNILVGLTGLCAIPLRTQNISPIPDAPPPKFWFGDRVSYHWVSDGGQQHSETGKVIGAFWHPIEKRWNYHVLWLNSTLDRKKAEPYPSFDEVPVLEKHLYFEG